MRNQSDCGNEIPLHMHHQQGTSGAPTRLLPLITSALLIAACGGKAPPTPEAMNRSYEQALARSAHAAAELPAGEGTRAVFTRLEQFFAIGDEAALVARAREVYAPDAYLNDNLAIVEGPAAIGGYFGRTARRVRSLRVEMLDISHSGVDYFVRWRMTVDAPRLRAETPLVSYGVTHFRFNAAGQVLVHKDFWDAGTGLYEYIPGLGSLTRAVRSAADSG